MSLSVSACLFNLHYRTNIQIDDIDALQTKSIAVGLFEGLGKNTQYGRGCCHRHRPDSTQQEECQI